MIDFFEFVYVWFRLQGMGVPKHQKKIARWVSGIWSSETRRQALLMAFRNSGKSTIVGLFCAWILYSRPSRGFWLLLPTMPCQKDGAERQKGLLNNIR